MDDHQTGREEAAAEIAANEKGAGVGDQAEATASAEPDAADNVTATGPRPDAPPGTSVVPRKAQLIANERGWIAPTSIQEAMRMAEAVILGNLAPDSYNNEPAKVMLGIMAALEAGLPPLYGLRQIAIIKGRPTIWGDAAMALIQSKNLLKNQTITEVGRVEGDGFDEAGFDPDKVGIEKWPDDYGFEVRLWRRGQEEPYVGRFTVGDAKRAKLWMNAKKEPWLFSPKRMLMIRARAFPQRDGFADALAGLAIREEMEDIFGDAPELNTAFLDDTPVAEVPPMPGEAVDKPVEENNG